MAEIVLFEIAGSIIKSLGSLVLQEIGRLWGFKDELRKLESTVLTIQAVLLDAEEKQANSHAVKVWLGNLKDVMYEADDLLDDFSTELQRRQVMTRDKKAKQVRIFFFKSNQLTYGRKMGYMIKAIRKRLSEIAADRHTFGLIERSMAIQSKHMKREDTHSFVSEEEVIGREDAQKDVKMRLLDSDVKEDVSIIPIVGIGGLGKTTLAQYVFNDEEVQSCFDLKVWVYVSDPFDVKTIVQKFIESATKKRPESVEMDPLQSELRVTIGGKRFLLVLDDVWNEDRDRWLRFKTLLVGGLRGSKVLVTTRSTKVAEIIGTVSSYLLGGLSESSSWDLFKRMAFKDRKEPKNPKLVEIGKEIVQKCARNPLAIRSIGSLLYFKNSEDEWLYFKNSELHKITQQEENDIFPILKLSYDHLPSQLKQCFAFCSLFPKNYKIEVKVLIQLWTAQGFIHLSDRTRCLEDVGREYFMDLLWRSFFQDIQRDVHGDIEKCKMHDLIHDLAQLVAEDECIISYPDAENVVERTRHVAFNSLYSLPDPAHLLKAHKMRTLLMGNSPDPFSWTRPVHEWNKPVYDKFISSFKCLRALNLSGWNIQEVPNCIGDLKHLRLLDLSRNRNIEQLPASITKLQNLQTLILDWCSKLKELPKDTRNLINLRHLELRGCDNLIHMPRGLGRLTALQTLSTYTLGKKESSIPKRRGGLGDLDGLDELRGDLCIVGLAHLRSSPPLLLEAKNAHLERKQYLRILKLDWGTYVEAGDDRDKAIENDEKLLQNLRPHLNLKKLTVSGYAGVRFSSWVSSLSNLVDISIWNCEWCQHIPPLNRFPSLKRLSLENLSALEYIGNDGSDVSSSSLEGIFLVDLPKLRGWWRMREAVTAEHDEHHHLPLFPSFPCLSGLEIWNCPIMSLVPLIPSGCQTTHSSSSPFAGLSKLKILCLGGLEELESLPEEWLPNLTSLKRLDIFKCCKLRISMSPLFQHLTALEVLKIENCMELISNEDEEGAQCLGPTSLRHLSIKDVTSLVSLPRELRHVTTLQQLDINNCPTLNSLPEWIGDLNSLQDLQIRNCPNLISLPEGMRRLITLSQLRIVECPLLEKRCEQGTGADWPKIAHVPDFSNQWYL